MVDSAGRLPNGDTFADIDQFRTLLVERSNQLHRCLTEKLMRYALGRKLTAADRPEVDAIVKKLDGESAGLKDLIRWIVDSKVFRTN